MRLPFFWSLFASLAVAGAPPPVSAATQCASSPESGAYVCVGPGTYYIRLRSGTVIEGQCSRGARSSLGVPFAILSDVHERLCGKPLELIP